MRAVIFVIMIVLISAGAYAEAGPKPVGPIYGSTGTVYAPGKLGVIFKYDSFDQDSIYDDNDEKNYSPSEIKGAYDKKVTHYQTTFRYGILPRFDIRLAVHYFQKDLKRHAAKNTPAGINHVYMDDDNSGIGDSVLMGRYQVFSQKAGDPVFFAVGAGVKMPTGSTSETGANGTLLPVFLQNGSGSWDPKVEMGLSKVFDRFRIDSHMMYTFNREGSQDTKKGNCLRYNVSGSYALSKHFDAELELFGRHQAKTEIDGDKNNNSGFTAHYLIPGIKFKFGQRGHAGIALPYVVNRNTNGEMLMDEDYRVMLKLALFF